MNRPGKQYCDVAIDGMPAARVAGEDTLVGADEIKPKKLAARPIDVATRLLQLVSLFVLFVFGIVGASLFTLRPSGMSHPALQRGTSLVVHRLTKHIAAHGHAARYSPPVHFSLVILRLRAGSDKYNDDVADVAKRFAPDFFVLETEQQTDAATSIEQALPDHTCIPNVSGATSSVCFDRGVWSDRAHGLQSTEKKDEDASKRLCAWEVHWARFEREVSTRSASASHGRHWHNATLMVVSVRLNPAEDTGCNGEATLADLVDSFRIGEHSSQPPIIITGLPSILQPSLAFAGLTDPFEFLRTAQTRSSVVANSRVRPVSASAESSVDAPISVDSPVSVVYELLPPQGQN